MNKENTTSTSSPSEQYHQKQKLLQKKKEMGDQEPRPFDEKTARFVRFEYDSNDINDRSEAFIKTFRRKLEMQRLDSIENYHQMLARGH